MQVVSRAEVLDHVKPGCVLWRPLTKDGMLAPVRPTKQEGRHPFVRVAMDGYGQFIAEPCVIADGAATHQRGIITFLLADLPPCWTHLVVERASPQCIRATPECADTAEYIAFRKEVEEAYFTDIRTLQELADAIRSAPCPVDRLRFPCFNNPDGGYYVVTDQGSRR